jgi:hypothetical protein
MYLSDHKWSASAHCTLCAISTIAANHATCQCAPRRQESDNDNEVILGGMDLPNEGNDFDMGNVDFDPPDSHEDGAAELHKDGHMAVDGEEYFPRFAEEFLAH